MFNPNNPNFDANAQFSSANNGGAINNGQQQSPGPNPQWINPWYRPYWMDNRSNMVANGYPNNTGFSGNTENIGAQSQQVPTQSSILGRIVNNPKDIMPKDVPMDGSISIFPISDLSAIFVKGWNENGRMITLRYIVDPDFQDTYSDHVNEQQRDILRRLENLEKSIAGNKSTGRSSKGTGKDGKDDDA